MRLLTAIAAFATLAGCAAAPPDSYTPEGKAYVQLVRDGAPAIDRCIAALNAETASAEGSEERRRWYGIVEVECEGLLVPPVDPDDAEPTAP